MKYSEVIGEVARELGLPEEVVDKGYKAYWYFIKQSIESLPLKEDISEEEFSKLRTNFNIPSLGKMSITWERLCGCKKRFNYIKHLREKK